MNFIYRLYYLLPNFTFLGVPGKAINKIMAMVLKRIFDNFWPAYFRRTAQKAGSGIYSGENRGEQYIVSLTSFPARANDIWISIETILRQSFKPDMIILWLAEEQFPDKKLPVSLTNLVSRGLTIKYCDDLRSHKKYYYAFKEFPEACIITLDDDLYYHRDVLLNIVKLHQKFPGMITTNRAHKFTFDSNGIRPYRKWDHNVTDILPSHLLMQTGGAGTLYPPDSLHPNAFDKDAIRSLCFHADDVWLKLMCFMNNKLVVTNRLYNKDNITIASTQNEKLVSMNVFDGGNDQQLKKVCDYYSIDINSLNDGKH